MSVTGCREDCAHAYLSDIGLTAATKLVAGRPLAGFNVAVGGTVGSSCRSLARDLDLFVTPDQAPDLVMALASLFRDCGERENRRTRIQVEGRQVAAVNVYAGGSPGPGAVLGKLVAEKVPLDELGALVGRLFTADAIPRAVR